MYNHAYDLAFTVISDSAEGEDVTKQMLLTAILQRLTELVNSDELEEACGAPFDSYETDQCLH